MANNEASQNKNYDQAQNSIPYKLELYLRGLNSPRATFYFLINPQNYNVTEMDRIGTTKTFGGTWIENFGPDDKKIMLSGDFGQSVESTGWDGTIKQIKGARGALKYLRDNFVRLAQKAIDEGKPVNSYYLKFYDLTSVESNHTGWLVKVDSFRTERDKSGPFNYKWNLTLTAYGKTFVGLPSFEFAKNRTIVGNLKNFVKSKFKKYDSSFTGPTIGTWQDANVFSKAIQAFNNTVDRLVYSVQNYAGAIDEVSTELNKITDQTNESLQNLVADVGNAKIAVEKVLTDIDQFPNNLVDIKNNVVESITTSVKLGVDLAANIFIQLGDWIISGFIGEGLAAGIYKSATEMEFSASILGNKPELLAGSGLVKITNSDGDQILNTTEDAANENTLPTFSRVQNIVQADVPLNLSLAEIAETFLGSIDLADDIAAANPDIDWENRQPGDVILIPTEVPIADVISSGNQVYSLDAMGADVRLDPNGYMVVRSDGLDVAIIDSYANLRQAITRRLNTEAATLAADETYGLRLSNYIGQVSKQTFLTIVEAGLIGAVLKDPRVSRIDEFSITNPSPDAIQIDMTMRLVNSGQFKLSTTLANGDQLTKIFSG